MCSRPRGEDVSFRDVKIKIPDRKIWQGGVNDVMHRKRARRIWGIWEKSGSWVFASEEEGWLSELAEALRRVPHVVWGRWKNQHRKIVYLSPYVEKPFNSKEIKSFVPELRSRKCFCVSGFLCALWTFYVYFTYSCMAMLQFKNEITSKQFTYQSFMYIHLTVCKQMTDVKLLLLHVLYTYRRSNKRRVKNSFR